MEETKKDSPVIVAESVKKFLRQRGTIKDAAATLGVSPQTLSTQLKNANKTYLSYKIAKRLSDAFEFDENYLVTGQGKLIKENRGGERLGAGRPRMLEENLRKNVTIRLDPETIQYFHDIQSKGISIGRLIDSLIRFYCRLPGIDVTSYREQKNENLTFE